MLHFKVILLNMSISIWAKGIVSASDWDRDHGCFNNTFLTRFPDYPLVLIANKNEWQVLFHVSPVSV